MPSDYHEQIVRWWCEREGFCAQKFGHAVRHRLLMEPWRSDGEGPDDGWYANDEIIHLVRSLRFTPDCYRFRIESRPQWGHPVLVLEVIEVEWTHPVDWDKIRKYERLWWEMDGTERLHFRAYRSSAPGHLERLMDESVAHGLMSLDAKEAVA